MDQLAIGVDIGGTRTKFGLVNTRTGQMIDKIIHSTEKAKEDAFLLQIRSVIQEFQIVANNMGNNISGIGFGVPGYVNEIGIVDSTYGFLDFMVNYPLVKMIENEFDLPTHVDNDARMVALGEALYGTGKGINRVLVLTLGTGLGIGFVVDGAFTDQLPVGHMAGHLTVSDRRDICYCGKSGCLEALVSSVGIIGAGNDLNWAEKYPDIPLSAEAVFAAAKEKKHDAKKIIDQLIFFLRTGIHNYINLFAPDIVVLGGGISKGLEEYIDQLKDVNYLRPYKKYKVKIAISTLEEQAGILGAAALVKIKAIHAI